MTVYAEIKELTKKKKVHMTLIDPATQDPERSALIAKEAERAGTDFLMIGGSTLIDSLKIRQTIDRIKEETKKKTIIFPGSASMISDNADAIYFMTLLNSRSTKFLIEQQAAAAPILKKMGIETIPMGYLVFEPGMTVGKVGDAELIGREDEKKAVSFSLAAEMLGMKLVYLESGSGSPTFVSEKVIRSVSSMLEIPLIVGGGIRDPEAASRVAEAGADIVVTGTVAERTAHVYETLHPIVEAVQATKHR